MQHRAYRGAEAGRLERWLATAVILHVAAFTWAGRVHPRARAAAAEGVATIEIATEPLANAVKLPEPPPAVRPRLDDAAGAPVLRHPVAAPPVPKPPSPRPAPPAAAGAPGPTPLAERLANALSAVATEASKILVSPDGHGPPIATGNADAAYGMVAGDGTGSPATFDARAGLRGRPGGSGQPPAGEDIDRSRGAEVNMGFNTDCDFPAEADRDRIDHGWAMLIVNVLPSGRAAGVQLLSDSGHGFGRKAVECARAAHYRPALDHSGKPIQADTPSFRYRFTR